MGIMVASLIALGLVQQDLPKDFDDLLAKMSKAFHGLSNYTDSWELTDDTKPSQGLRFSRRIDGRRVWMRTSTFKPGPQGITETPVFEQGTNGKEMFGIVYSTRSYYRAKDDGSFQLD